MIDIIFVFSKCNICSWNEWGKFEADVININNA